MSSITEGAFPYDNAFSRNLGWVTEAEQQKLRKAKVAVAGLGGVGGFHVTTLARFGIGAFSIADFDNFDVPNFNRQAGAMVSTLGRPKAEVIGAMVKDINPSADLQVYPKGVDESNIDEFLKGATVYVDGLDFFAFKARQLAFAACHRLGIPAVTAAPLGMGTSVLVFLPGQMSFEEYFGFEGCNDTEKALRFLLGLTPKRLHNSYLVEPDRINLQEKRGPSTVAGCMLCAGVAATETVKLILGRGEIRAAPWSYHVDAYTHHAAWSWRPMGYRNPLQRLGFKLGMAMLSQSATK
ncbi:ThiF family adenylyltransferase [Chitinimonas sp. BJB300]|uniref:ThiF family adenylyltransferase n=1 Tax=Chitinimonas sp. BJB300 TaxID=1559339 RepID=UPI000C11B3D9|nr:ThiF family adenylyltransferase [Chitinimonas sp. BJB300]PHV12129.1 hypothetical protein CSQ89_07460 [Chitinimonas sp. BJB300]TSJ89044.1 ThiF family adenylyltransferase [Chitinimonas sp. BJB300]